MIGKQVQSLVSQLKELPNSDAFRDKITEQLLDKLHGMGIAEQKHSLAVAEKVSVSAFCRRRLPVVMVKLKMSQTLKEAVTLVEQGHVRVGPQVVTDPGFLVTRSFEDYVTWVDSSKIKRTIMKYNDKLDDFDLLGN